MPRKRVTRAGRRTASDVFTRSDALARNLWWTWNPDPQRLFAALDPVLWEATNHNPIRTLRLLSAERRETLAADADFLTLLAACERQLAAYLRTRTWFQRTATPQHRRLRIAYFCAEFGLHECLPQYAGGLGVLAGDHLKSASDLGLPLVGVGLLYRSGYYRQELHRDGSTRATFPTLDLADLPIQDTGVTITIPLGERHIAAQIRLVQVGRVPLYLLSTDLPVNRPRDRDITARLYGGDQEMRIQQEIVLGIGGVRALDALGVRANVFHMNEGHAAFCSLERLRHGRARGLSWDKALARVSAGSVFTTHTPVPAGHDRFPARLMRKYLGPLLAELHVDEHMWLGLGRVNPDNRREPFCMTVLALLTSDECNGVSKLHGQVSREMWRDVYTAKRTATVPITHITNGIHTATWLAPELRPLYDKYLKPRWVEAGPRDDCWRRAGRIPPAELWHARNLLRRKLVQFIDERLKQQAQRRGAPLDALVAALDTFDERTLTIGFARRFATYKRATLIFHDQHRLAALLNNAQRPVQLVFAGKAHPADADGQKLAQQIHRLADRAGLRGRIALIEDYDMHVGRVLTAGCDVWLNNPLRPQEASGTSGMKPPLHGGLNCSILDGWWPEAYNRRNGWAIREAKDAPTRAAQDHREAAALYELLEEQIVPLFYQRDRQGIPRGWVRRMINGLKTICGQFNTHRMVAEYLDLYTTGLFPRS